MDVWLCAGLCRGVSEEVITLLTSVNNNKFTSNTKFMKICQTQSCRSRSNMGNPSGGTLLMNERVSGSAKRWQVNMNDTMQQQSEFRSNFKLFTFNAISSIIDFDSLEITLFNFQPNEIDGNSCRAMETRVKSIYSMKRLAFPSAFYNRAVGPKKTSAPYAGMHLRPIKCRNRNAIIFSFFVLRKTK